MAIDIESCTELNKEVNPNQENESSKKVLVGLRDVEWSTRVDESDFMNHGGDKVGTENMDTVIDINPKIDGVVVVEKEKRKSMSAKKPPKPPRPPRDMPLDAADKKLVKEIAELTMIKRARRKALKKSRAAKALNSLSSSSSSSSGGSYLAMLLTFVFCLVLVCHGLSSKIKSSTSLGDTLFSNGGSDHMGHPSSRDSSSSPSGSSNLVEPALNVDNENISKGATS